MKMTATAAKFAWVVVYGVCRTAIAMAAVKKLQEKRN